jgi:DNA-binding SARP family transcriptional activator
MDRSGCEVHISAAKQRTVLVSLAVRLGSVVPAWRLIEALWRHNPPASASKTLQTYISALRRSISSGLIETVDDGYRLTVAAADLDTARFEQLLRMGQDAVVTGHPVYGKACLIDALSLWRGEPLADASYDLVATGESVRLSELRRAAEEWLVDARLLAGEHETLVADLESFVAVEPFRERRWEQLMIALYRSARQADALRVYQRYRTALIDHTGLEPSPRICQLEQNFLQQKPSRGEAGPAGGCRSLATRAP